MAGGWSRDGAVQEQIDATVEDEIQRTRARHSARESARFCSECDALIPEARRIAVPGVELCVACQAEHERTESRFSGINRRGSKDSQLR